jgi:hypothetical protein
MFSPRRCVPRATATPAREIQGPISHKRFAGPRQSDSEESGEERGASGLARVFFLVLGGTPKSSRGVVEAAKVATIAPRPAADLERATRNSSCDATLGGVAGVGVHAASWEAQPNWGLADSTPATPHKVSSPPPTAFPPATYLPRRLCFRDFCAAFRFAFSRFAASRSRSGAPASKRSALSRN